MYIGVGGQQQNGKDTVSDYLKKQLDTYYRTWKRTAFASNVKRIFMDTFEKDPSYVERWKVEPKNPPDLDMAVRKALQFIGDGFRQIKSTIWLDLIFRNPEPQIISDLRYINEFKAVHDHKGYCLLVVNPDKLNDDPNGSEAQIRPLVVWALNHRYEAKNLLEQVKRNPQEYDAPEEIKYINMILFNDGSIKSLYEKIDQFVIPEINKFFSKEKTCLTSSK